MKFLLDTNAVIAIIAGHRQIIDRLADYAPRDFALPSVGLHELYFGAFKSQRVEANLARIEALRFEVLELTEQDARAAGEIRAELGRLGTPIGPYDVLIAGQALARERVLITNNLREFDRVPGLQAEDWLG